KSEVNDPLWVANYTSGCPKIPAPWTNWVFWQYSESGTTPGLTHAVDMDVFNGTFEQLKAFANSGTGGAGGGTTSSSATPSSTGTGAGGPGGAGGSSTSRTTSSTNATTSASSTTSTGSGGPPPPTCHVNGVAGTCIDTSMCASMVGYTSTPG